MQNRSIKNRCLAKVLLSLFLLSVLAYFASAQDETTPVKPEWDYVKLDTYQDPVFYQTSNPHQWDWNKVDWSYTDVYLRAEIYDIPEVYKQSGFYANIPDDRIYKLLDYNLVNYGKDGIKQDKINVEEYFKDLKCHDCLLSNKKKYKVTFSEKGITYKDSAVSIPGTYPQNTKFTVEKDRIVVELPADVQEFTAGDDDSFTLRTKGKDKTLATASGKFTVNGDLSFNKGTAYVAKYDRAEIIGVRVNANNNNVNIYFDGRQEKNPLFDYVSFDQANKKMSAWKRAGSIGEGFSLIFNGNKNPFLPADKDQFLAFRPEQNSQVFIQNRGKDLLPLVEINLGKTKKNMPVEDFFLITQGDHLFVLNDQEPFQYGGQIKDIIKYVKGIEVEKESPDSIPLVLRVKDGNRKPLMKAFDDEAEVIFDNYKNYAFAPVSQPGGYSEVNYECSALSCQSNVFNDNSLLYYHALGLISTNTPVKSVTGTKDPAKISFLWYGLSGVPDELKKHFDSIEFFPEKDVVKVCGDKEVSACVDDKQPRKILIDEDDFVYHYNLPPRELLIHEAGHSFTFYSNNRRDQLAKQIPDLDLRLKAGRDVLAQAGYSEQQIEKIVKGEDPNSKLLSRSIKPLNDQREASQEELDRLIDMTQWERRSNSNYGTTHKKDNYDAVWAEPDENGYVSNPRYGCVTPYACGDVYEDIAENFANYNTPLMDELVSGKVDPANRDLYRSNFRLICLALKDKNCDRFK